MDDDSPDDDPTITIAKPDELLALHGVTAELFESLRNWFDVPPHVTLDLREVDSAVTELGDPVLIAAMAMRKLQALNLLSTPGVMTTTDVVVTIVGDLDRALLQAPTMRLRVQAAETDWDEAFELLADDDGPEGSEAPADADAADPEAERFQQLHGYLHQAVHAVIEASEGQIRYLV
jgi:hypothetical protein